MNNSKDILPNNGSDSRLENLLNQVFQNEAQNGVNINDKDWTDWEANLKGLKGGAIMDTMEPTPSRRDSILKASAGSDITEFTEDPLKLIQFFEWMT